MHAQFHHAARQRGLFRQANFIETSIRNVQTVLIEAVVPTLDVPPLLSELAGSIATANKAVKD